MARRGSDYIPTESEKIAREEELKEYKRTHADPRTEYIATYDVPQYPGYTERIMAMNIDDATQIIKRTCGLVGWIPQNLKIVEANKLVNA